MSGFKQFSALVNILAALVFPTPRDPENKKACATLSEITAFRKVWAAVSCPIRSPKQAGRSLRASTT